MQWTRSGVLPGAALLIRQAGETKLSFACGYASFDPEIPATIDHIWVVASISKPVAATALLQLVDRGLVRLEQKVSELLPEFKPETVMVRHLLTHTSGLCAMEPEVGLIREKGRIRAIADQGLLFEPGTKCSYSTPALDLIEEIVSRISGLNWVEYTQRHLFQPTQMHHTSYYLPVVWRDKLARVYDSQNQVDPWWNEHYLRDIGLAGGGMFSTLQDLGSFADAFLNGGSPLLTLNGYKEMTRLQTPGLFNLEGAVQTWGLGWYLNQDNEKASGFGPLSQNAFGHGGATGTWFCIDPDSKLTAVFLTNRLGISLAEITAMQNRLMTILLKELS